MTLESSTSYAFPKQELFPYAGRLSSWPGIAMEPFKPEGAAMHAPNVGSGAFARRAHSVRDVVTQENNNWQHAD